MQTLHYCIAGWNIALHMENGLSDNLQLEPYIPFICSEHKADNILFELYAQKTQPNNPAIGTIIGNFQCSNAIFSVYSHAKGCYTFDVYTFSNKSVPCCRIQASTGFYHVKVSLSGDKQLCTFGLNNAMMIAFAFASAPYRTLLLHASAISCHGKSYLFLGKSGTGKSTHARLWLKHIPETELLNDDNPVIRFVNDMAYVYGTPWSGKTSCYRNVSTPIGAIVRLLQAPENHISKHSTIKAFASCLSSCSSMVWDKFSYHEICQTVSDIVRHVPFYELQCKPDAEAAQLCFSTIENEN